MYYDWQDLQRRLDEMPPVYGSNPSKIGGVSPTSTPEEDRIYTEVWIEGFYTLSELLTGWLRYEYILTEKETFLQQLKASARILPQIPAKNIQMATWASEVFPLIVPTLERLYTARRGFAAQRRAQAVRRGVIR